MNLRIAPVSLFESLTAPLRSNEGSEGPEISSYYYSSGRSISLSATFLNQPSPTGVLKEPNVIHIYIYICT